MYDPMVAKLIVWDADREQATQRMLRALDEYEIEGLKTLIPFHKALLATEEWKRGSTCKELLEDKKWLKTLAFEKPPAPVEAPRRSRRRSSRPTRSRSPASASTCASSARRSPAAASLRATAPRRGPKALEAQRAQVLGRRRRRRRAPLAASGQHVEGARQAGRHGRGGPAALHHRGDEDGERDHRAQGRHDRRAADRRGRADPGRRADRDDHLTAAAPAE